jgi:hypothetical protein
MGDMKPGSAHCPCGDPRCLLWTPQPSEPWRQDWCGDCYPQAVARHWDASMSAKRARLRVVVQERTGKAA